MAIIGPADLPQVLKVDSNPLKKRVLQALGHPNIRVELTEDQLEELLRVTGDFIAQYFPKEERYAFFYTQPLQAEYDFPEDAYWIREVAWDAVITRIQDIFGAEMFLFCAHPNSFLARSDGDLIPLDKWEKDFRINTPYGDDQVEFIQHDKKQPLVEIRHEKGSYIGTPNHPIKINSFDFENSFSDWKMAKDIDSNDKLLTPTGFSKFVATRVCEPNETVTIVPKESHCCFVSHDGDPILVH
ncbi:MAG: hypothetical protein GF411_02785 [Candidatus Lokiarchaeota archaeon]|nr:hypothetical protein [Candidatus Lokiarchaeota archaeon]